MRYRTLLGRGAFLLCSLSLATGTFGCSDGDDDGDQTAGGSYARPVLDDLSPAALGSSDAVRELATAASAPSVFGITMVAVALPQMSEDEACPVRETDGGVTRFIGGCTDADGREWLGEVTIEAGVGDSRATFDGFGISGGSDSVTECSGELGAGVMIFDGVIVFGGSPAELRFEIDLKAEVDQAVGPDCQRQQGQVAWDYQGSFQAVGPDNDGDGQKDDVLWNGSGRVGSTVTGVVDARTDDELLSDEGCDSEAESGITALVAGGDTATVTYDGATDCDPEATVRWTLNGDDKGELQGVSCCAAPGRLGHGGWLVGGLLVAAALARSRRR